MKIISVTNQKGGVGKTTTTVQFAFHLQQKGFKVLVIDLDAQKNTSDVLSNYNEISISDFMSNKAFSSKSNNSLDVVYADTSLISIDKRDLYDVCSSFKKSVDAVATNYDYCIIDTAPTLNQSVTMSLIVSDYVLAPTQMNSLAFRGLEQLFSSIEEAREYNSNLKILAIVATMVNNHSPKEKQMFEQVVKTYPDDVVSQKISLRSAVADSIADKKPIWEVKSESGRKAKKEFASAFELILAKTLLLS